MTHDTTKKTHGQTGNGSESAKVAAIAGDERLSASEAAVACFKEYARERPEVVAVWAFGVGFVLGWKLKIW